MGAWGANTFDNDTAGDWAYELEDTDDLSLVEGALEAVRDVEPGEMIDSDLGAEALAACEVIARLRGRRGEPEETVDAWVKKRGRKLVPSPALVALAVAAIDRITGPDSELAELWEAENGTAWRASVAGLRQRVAG